MRKKTGMTMMKKRRMRVGFAMLNVLENLGSLKQAVV